MKITQSQVIPQTIAIQKTDTAKQQTSTQEQLDSYTSAKRQELWGYSVNEVKKIVPNTFTHPNWNLIPTKGMETPPQEQLVAQIQDLARNVPDKKTGTKEEWDLFWAKKYQLRTQYTSLVSPDRKALHAAALKVAKKVEEEQPKHTRPLTLVDYLIMDDLDLTLEPETRKMMQNASITPIHRTGGGYDYEINYGGQVVMRSINGSWGYDATPAELARQNEFELIFEAAQVG